jgi:hypothetical protein
VTFPNVPCFPCTRTLPARGVTPLEQRARVLLARRQALENGRPVAPSLLAADAVAEGLDPADLYEGVRRLVRSGLAMRVGDAWTLLPPPLPQDATEALAQRVRLAEPHR